MIRLATPADLAGVIRLHSFLHPEDPVLDPDSETVIAHWNSILSDDKSRYYVAELNSRIVSACVLTMIPNLTRGLRPYGLIENVVTAPDFRRRGMAASLLQAALHEAWAHRCYKVMLLTGRNDESVFRCYEHAGFKRGIKTGFIAFP